MIDLLRRRRSIRRFRPDPIPVPVLRLLSEALLRSPSSRSINPWRFVFVDDPALLPRLGESKEHGAEFLAGAPLAIVVCADGTKSDVWIEDCSIAAILVQMAAISAGLGSCWAQIRNRRHDRHKSAEEYVKEVLDLPEQIQVECIIGLGFPAERKRSVSASALHFDKLHHNRWGEILNLPEE